jgi:hypothetical protein
MLLFRAKEHVRRWCRMHDLSPGATITPEQGWRLAHGWYKDKIKADWRRHTLEETEALLGSIGLEGSFWNLRE